MCDIVCKRKYKWPSSNQSILGTYKVRNEIETKTKRNEINENETKRNQRNGNEIDWYEENGRKKIKDNTK